MIKSDFHVHTRYCDGTDSPRDIIESALSLGLSELGFSSHGYTEFDTSYCMSRENQDSYIAEINALKKEFAGRIKLFCGVERDMLSSEPVSGFDYSIGSLHYVVRDGRYLPVDMSEQTTAEIIDSCYDGSFDSFAIDYFALLSERVKSANADIIGHFDLVTKYPELTPAVLSDRYLYAAESAVKSALCCTRVFEINTGAISRGIRSTPYPGEHILRMIRQNGGKIILSSDAHSKDTLCCGFDSAYELAAEAGFAGSDIVSTPFGGGL